MGLLDVVWGVTVCLMLGSALVAILHPRPVYNVLALLVTLFSVSLLFLLLGLQFLAVLYIYIYVGAVMTLFLIVVMLLPLKPGRDQAEARPDPRPSVLKWTGGVVAVGFFVLVGAGIRLGSGGSGTPQSAPDPLLPATALEIKSMAHLLFTHYLLPFEMTSILFLIAVVGAVLLVQQGDLRR